MVAAGAVIWVFLLPANKHQSDQGVVLNDIFHMQGAGSAASNVPSSRLKKVDPVPPLAIVTSPVAGQETAFTIQVYSFQDKTRAQRALQALKESGYQAFLIMSDLGEKGIWWRVRVGGITDEASARRMLEEIRKNYNSGFILKPGTN